MGFTVDKKEFVKALVTIMPAVPTRSSLPILSGVKLTAADTRFAMEATDLELSISLQAPATGNGNGVESTVVPAKALAKAVKSMSGSDVSVSMGGDDAKSAVEVASEKRRISIETYPVSDFPEITHGVEWQAVCWFEPKEFADALTKVVLCASNDDARPVLTGVQFNFGEDRLELAATDSYRLGVLSVETERMGEIPNGSPIVPARVLKSLAKQLKKHEGRGIVYLGSVGEDKPALRFIQFSFGATCWTTRQIEGEYPNWRQIMPAESGGILEFDSEELTTAVKGAAELRSQKSVPVKVSLDDSCVIRMAESQVADVSETLEGATYSPNGAGPMEIAFNPDFLIDGITFVAQEKGRMQASDPLKPVLLLGDGGSRYVLMPVRLSR